MTHEKLPAIVPAYHVATIQWYEGAASLYKYLYLGTKLFQLVVTSSIPLVALILSGQSGIRQGVVNGILAAILLVTEGVLQTLQVQAKWTEYRSTHNAIRREVLLLEANADDYGKTAHPVELFSDRMVMILSADHSAWMALQRSAEARDKADQDANKTGHDAVRHG